MRFRPRTLLICPLVFFLNLAGICDRDHTHEGVEVRGGDVQANENLPVLSPKGLRFEFLAGDMSSPRFLAFSEAGDLVVGSGNGDIYRLRPPYNRTEVLVKFRGYPHAVAFRKTARGEELWVAETDALYKSAYDSKRTYARDDFEQVASLPEGGGHDSRTVRIGPDQAVYVSIGISGNCSDEFLSESYPENLRRGGIFRLDESTKRLLPFVNGLRNPVGYDWHPETKALYVTNNGPDHWGYEQPGEVFVGASEGSFHGMPWYQTIEGQLQRDKCIGSKPPYGPEKVPAPLAYFPSRSAPLGMTFVPDERLKAEWKGSALVALHGSWGTSPTGSASGDAATRRQPKLVLVAFEGGRPTGDVRDVLTGFQNKDGDRFARPAGLAIGPDGALYLTMDAGKQGLYRLRTAE